MLTVTGRFLLGEWFILRVRKAPFLGENPTRVDERKLTASTPLEHDRVGSVHTGHVHGEAGREAYIYPGIPPGYIGRIPT